MQVLFESARSVGASLERRAEARLRFLLRRLSWLVPQATLRLSDLEDVRGGGKHCRVELSVVGAGEVVASATGRDWLQSIDGALGHAARLAWRRYRHAHQA